MLSDDLDKRYNKNMKDYGTEKGMEQKSVEIAIEMFKEHMEVEQIVKFTKLDNEKVLD